MAPESRRFGYLCAAIAFEAVSRQQDAVAALREAADLSIREGDAKLTQEALERLAVLWAESDREESFVSVWDELVDLGLSPILLSKHLYKFAGDAYARQDYQRSYELVTRLEKAFAGKLPGHPSLDPPWLPDLYLKLGKPGDAESVYLARIDAIHASWRLADQLDAYAQFLEGQGRFAEAREALQRASHLRDSNR